LKKFFSSGRFGLGVSAIFAALSLTMSSCSTVNIFRHSPLKMASYLEEKGDTEGAVRVLRGAAVSPRGSKKEKTEVMLALSAIYEKKNDVVSAINVLKETEELNKSDLLIGMKLGELYLKTGLLDEAEREFVRLEATEVKTASLYRGLGEIYYRKHYFYKASGYFSEYLRIYPDDRDALYKFYEMQESLGNYSRARSALASASSALPEKEFSVALAVNWMRDNNPDEAIEELAQMTEKYPELSFFMGLAYYQKGQDEKALEYFSKENPQYRDEADFFKAMILWGSGEKEEAAEIFKNLSEKEKFADYCSVFLPPQK